MVSVRCLSLHLRQHTNIAVHNSKAEAFCSMNSLKVGEEMNTHEMAELIWVPTWSRPRIANVDFSENIVMTTTMTMIVVSIENLHYHFCMADGIEICCSHNATPSAILESLLSIMSCHRHHCLLVDSSDWLFCWLVGCVLVL